MDSLIRENDETDGRSQQQLMEQLFKLEDKFRRTLIASPKGYDIYSQFMEYIQPSQKKGEPEPSDKGNTLMARIYFRERQNAFRSKIAPAFDKRDPRMLYKLQINYVFAKWVMDRYKGEKKRDLQRIFDKMTEVRRTVCENTLPSAIHRAKIFWSKIPYSHMEYMDMIQSASEGLLQAIDKFEPPFQKVFGSVVVSRMALNIMDGHNATLVKIPTKERRILYRAKNAQNKENLHSQEDILRYVSESFGDVSSQELAEIQAAADGVMSIDHRNDNGVSVGDTVVSSDNPEQNAHSADLTAKLNNGILSLDPIERKVVILKSGEMDVGNE
jgi:DNA-directed RNA polymerase specialized sigma subunit